jgi:signal transduction histidine kinase
MINMARHSGAHHVVVRFELSGDTLTISYRDDGIGFSSGLKFGNGLKSTETRIGSIGGEFIFVKDPPGGASIRIVIPMSKHDT